MDCSIFEVKHKTNYHYSCYYGEKLNSYSIMQGEDYQTIDGESCKVYSLEAYGGKLCYYYQTIISENKLEFDKLHHEFFILDNIRHTHKEPNGIEIGSFPLDATVEELRIGYHDPYNKPYISTVLPRKWWPHGYYKSIDTLENNNVYQYEDGIYYKNPKSGVWYKVYLTDAITLVNKKPNGEIISNINIIFYNENSYSVININEYLEHKIP